SIAGQELIKAFSPSTRLHYDFNWDGKDSYGRLLQGRQKVTVRIGYTYRGSYQKSSKFGQSGGGGVVAPGITGNKMRREITLWSTWEGSLGGWDATSL